MNAPSTPFHDQPSELPPSLASQGLRLVAFLIDCVVFAALLLAVSQLLLYVFDGIDERDARSILLILLTLTYSPIMTATWGGTAGKLICRIRVVRIGIADKYHDGNLGYWRALTRHLSHVVMTISCIFLVLDHLWCLWDKPNCQCLHDKIVKSAVIMR
ncbi:RDD family protein [Nonomuraea sp. NPDC050786]|uniref:RDD family protein n=1 Tax=Nonomuraea sp. NPDC050786 TaxID=3154840 RepID=UPI0033FFA0DA